MKKVRKSEKANRDPLSNDDARLVQKHNSTGGISYIVEGLYALLLRNAPRLITVIVAVSLLAMLVLRVYLIFAYIPELGGIESNVIYSLQRILAGYQLYVDPATAPYSITQYTPLYYYVCAALGKLFQVDPDQVQQVYILSRSVSLVLNLLFGATAFLILRRIFHLSRALSWLAFAYAFLYLDEESFSRPDSLYNLAFLLTVGLFLQWLASEKWQSNPLYLVGISACSVATIFVKQSGIYLPIILLFFLIFYRQNFRGVIIATLAMIGTFGVLFLMSAEGNVYAFWQNTVQGVNNGASLGWFADRIMIEHFQKERFINILGLFAGFYYLAKGKDDALKFLGLAILGSFVFALITSIKIGAAPNYFTEFITLSIIAIVVFVTRYDPWVRNYSNQSTHRSNGRSGSRSYRLLLYLIFVLFTLPPRFGGKFQKKFTEINNVGKEGYWEDRAIAQYLYRKEQLQPNDQIFVTTHVHDYLNKFLYRNVVFPQKEIVVANPPDTYDYREFRQGVQDGTIDYVIASLSEGHVDTLAREMNVAFDFLSTDFSPYVPIRRIGDYVIFEHQSRIN